MRIGRIEVIVGSMFSGKTSELMRRLEREELGKKRVACFKPENDDRYGYNVLTDRKKRFKMKEDDLFIIPRKLSREEQEKIFKIADYYNVIGFDEVQFFSPEIVTVCKELRSIGKKIICAGLDMDYRAEPFGSIGDILAIANDVLKLQAVCMCCGKDATYTQLLFDGKPAPNFGMVVKVGDLEEDKDRFSYQARCEECYVSPYVVSKKESVNEKERV